MEWGESLRGFEKGRLWHASMRLPKTDGLQGILFASLLSF